MLTYKADIMEELRKRGWTPQRIREEGKIGEAALTKIRAGHMVSAGILNMLCELTGKQPGQLIAWKPDPPPAAAAAEQKTE